MLLTGTFIALLFAWYVLPYAIKRFEILALRRRCRAQRAIVLTFDDGPSAEMTPKVQHLLGQYQAHATFFQLGKKIEVASDLVQELLGDGHEIGSHSYCHRNAWKSSPRAVGKDIQRGLEQTARFGPCRWFRPPHGKSTLATLMQVYLHGCRNAWWTIDSTDTWATPLAEEAVVDRIRQDGGGVLLLHDHDRSAFPGRAEYVLGLTRSVLEMARREGFSIATLGRLHAA